MFVRNSEERRDCLCLGGWLCVCVRVCVCVSGRLCVFECECVEGDLNKGRRFCNERHCYLFVHVLPQTLMPRSSLKPLQMIDVTVY
jgi:hypothetical protein